MNSINARRRAVALLRAQHRHTSAFVTALREGNAESDDLGDSHEARQLQQQYYVANPDFFPMVPAPAALLGLSGVQQTQSTVWEVDRHFRAPQMFQSSVSVEHQLPKNSTLSVT